MSETVLQRIVENAMDVLNASSAAVLSYDTDGQRFFGDFRSWPGLT